MKTHDLKKYKEAKAMLPHLEMILKILNLSEKSLTYYNSYIPVAKVLYTIKEQKALLQIYYDVCKKVKQSKGLK